MSKYKFFQEKFHAVALGGAAFASTVIGAGYLMRTLEKLELQRIQEFENTHPGEKWVRQPRRPIAPHRMGVFHYNIVPAKQSDIRDDKPQNGPASK